MDGIGDNTDKFPTDKTEWLNTDNDGTGDNADKFPTDKNEWLDTDKDGYGDNSDDFPTDSNLHEKIVILNASDIYVPLGSQRGQNENGSSFNIESDSKYVVINWRITNPTSLLANENPQIYFNIIQRESNQTYDWKASMENLRIAINSSNWGEWFYSFQTLSKDTTITIYREIYILK